MNKFVDIFFKGQKTTIRRSSGSHIPVLKSIAEIKNIKSVIELGTGLFSLKTLLDKNIFRQLEKIHSYETSDFWIEYMESQFNDSRWNIYMIKNTDEMAKSMRSIAPVDMVFVDGTYEHRLYVLNYLKDLSDLFVLHDCELDYFKSIMENGFKYKFVYKAPEYRYTAIFSDVIDVSKIKWNIKWDDSFKQWI
ncbi:MAG: hypothetical protein WC554_14875 [Clostridia bacterium]|jgi:hypothetical protein